MKQLPMTSAYSIERFRQLLYRTLIMNKNQMLLGFGGAVAGLFLFWLVMMIFDPNAVVREKAVIVLAGGTMIYQIAGYVFSASIFKELNTKETAAQFLTLPATAAEKLSAAWTVTYLIYSVISMASLTILLLLMSMSGQLFFGSEFLNISSMTGIYLNSILLFYLMFNAVFLFGAVFFRKYNFLKTAFSILLFLFSIVIISAAVSLLYGPVQIHLFHPGLLNSAQSAFIRFLIELLYALPITLLFLYLSHRWIQNRQVA